MTNSEYVIYRDFTAKDTRRAPEKREKEPTSCAADSSGIPGDSTRNRNQFDAPRTKNRGLLMILILSGAYIICAVEV